MRLETSYLLQNSKYRIIRVLGQGGFGITYLAENVLLDKKVAIKEFFPKDFCGRDTTSHLTIGTENNRETVERLKARFLKEARNIARLDHPGIVRVFDVFEENDTAYYVMEYIHGENLNEIVKRNGPLPEEKAVEYITKVGEALEYIHSRNMTHFDVKPANIIIRKEDDKPILIDFGLSKQYNKEGSVTSTMMHGVSQGFSPIELFNIGSIQTFSPQSDIYSLGATLFFLLTGKVPPNASELLEKELVLPPFLSESLKETIQRATKLKRAERFSSFKEFLQSFSQGRNKNTILSNCSKSFPVREQEEQTRVVNSQAKEEPLFYKLESDIDNITITKESLNIQEPIDKKNKTKSHSTPYLSIALGIIATLLVLLVVFFYYNNEGRSKGVEANTLPNTTVSKTSGDIGSAYSDQKAIIADLQPTRFFDKYEPKRFSRLTSEEYQKWKAEQTEKGRITPRTSYAQIEILYNNQLFIKLFGVEEAKRLSYDERINKLDDYFVNFE